MAFRISKFLPLANRADIKGPGQPTLFGWRRRFYPTPGGQNFSASERQVPTQSMSGALNLIARPFRPLEPALAYSVTQGRQIANATITPAGIVNGQIFSSPLVDPNTGGFGRALTPILARPFDIFGIRPAGKF